MFLSVRDNINSSPKSHSFHAHNFLSVYATEYLVSQRSLFFTAFKTPFLSRLFIDRPYTDENAQTIAMLYQ